MLIRISLIIAIVAGLAVGVVNFIQVKEIIDVTRKERDDNKTAWDAETAAHNQTKREFDATNKVLVATLDKLQTTTAELDTARTDAEKNRKLAADLNTKLKATTDDRDDARRELAAWAALGLKVEQIKTVIADLKLSQEAVTALAEEKKMLSSKIAKLENDLAYYRDPEYQVKLPANLRGTVVVADPKWEFVVLNVGEDQGVLERGELLVNRDGKLVAKVRVLRVEKNRCIANVLSGWKLAEVVEGDLAIPAF
jgi:hypothetical protein